jgi:hypothetical protein
MTVHAERRGLSTAWDVRFLNTHFAEDDRVGKDERNSPPVLFPGVGTRGNLSFAFLNGDRLTGGEV